MKNEKGHKIEQQGLGLNFSVADGEIKAIDTPKKLKQENSNHQVEIDYLYKGERSRKGRYISLKRD